MSSSSASVTTSLPNSFISGSSSASVSVPPKPQNQPKREDLQILEYSTVVEQDHDSLDPWGKVLQRVIKAIVSIKGTRLRTFDTECAGLYQGTGFVVDRSRGIILSNRHIVSPGPITASAIFGNYEEVSLKQDYYDPVHDFGFFRYDCTKIKFAEVEEIELYPQGAKVGLDIKVCGNDAGEKLSILSSTLARLDRHAPNLGNGYNDFNINYFQAASGTSPGSSGSPVLDIKGRAVALNASGRIDSASAFFLPLEPVVRALKFVQEGIRVPRGTLQTEFIHSSYDELRRLGLPQEIENEFRERNRAGTGLLLVSEVLPEGPGYKAGIAVGDILVECAQENFGRRFIDDFHSLWEIIDASVDKEATFVVYRGDQRKEFSVAIEDLHSVTPNTFVEVGNASVHPLSYQLARVYHMPCKGLYVAYSGIFNWAGPGGGFLITQLAGKPVDSLENFVQIYLSLEDRKKVGFRFMMLGGFEELLGIVEIDHHFYVSAQYTRNASWKRKVLSPNPIIERQPPQRAPTLLLTGTRVENLRQILVMIRCRVPYSVDGIEGHATYSGVGTLVTTTPMPLIVTSRTVIPASICDISVTIGKRNFTARVVHVGLIVVLAIDASRIPPDLHIPSMSDKNYRVGDAIEVFGLNYQHQLMQRRTEISAISAIVCGRHYPPSWRMVNTEGYSLLDCPNTMGGVLIDPKDDSLVALWMAAEGGFYTGLDYRYYIHPIIESLRAGAEVKRWCSGWEFGYIHLARAMDLGMPEHHAARIDNIAKDIGTGAQAIWVSHKLHQFSTDLNVGDFILEIDGATVGRMADIRCLSEAETANVLILRNRQEKEVLVHAKELPSQGMSRIICWAGAILQPSPPAALEQTTPEFMHVAEIEGVTNPEDLVYISSLFNGSPGHGVLNPTIWILEIAEHKVRKLDDLIDIITSLKERSENEEYIRVKLMGRDGSTGIVGLKLNSHFWPAWTLGRKGIKWVRQELE